MGGKERIPVVNKKHVQRDAAISQAREPLLGGKGVFKGLKRFGRFSKIRKQ